jgi:biopolymer transport protein ExbD
MDDDIESINVVPLVDVMLVLLTIVLTTASFVATGHIPVHLANSTQAAAAPAVPVVITLTRDLQLYVNDQAVSDIAPALVGFSRAQTVAVRADGGLALTHLVDLVDRIKALGFESVALEVKRS